MDENGNFGISVIITGSLHEHRQLRRGPTQQLLWCYQKFVNPCTPYSRFHQCFYRSSITKIINDRKITIRISENSKAFLIIFIPFVLVQWPLNVQKYFATKTYCMQQKSLLHLFSFTFCLKTELQYMDRKRCCEN